jgi:phenylacetate-CoA ligase
MESLLTRAAWTAYAMVQGPLQRRAAFRSPAWLERAQRRRLRGMVVYAHQHVPYYRETLGRLGLTPADFATAGDLARLPLIEREQLQRDPEYFLSTERPIEEYVKLATDGTTGVPVTVYHDPFALFRGATFSERREAILFKLARRRFRLRRVSVTSPQGTVARTSRAFRRRSLVPARLRYSDLWLSMEDAPARNIERISEFRADVLRCYGSVVQSLFLEAHRSGRPFRAPKVVIYGADAVPEPVRRLIADDFGVHLLSEYGAGEAHQIALECEEHSGLHLNSDFCPVRIVDPDGRHLPDGEFGEVVVSNLVNRATVLLNYRLGDRAAKLPERCPCGRSLPLLSYPAGRTDDWVETAAGERVHAQAVRGLLLADDRWVLAFQVEQLLPSRFAVSAVVAEGTDRDALRSRIEERFANRFGEGTITEVRFVESLERTPGGKVRVVKSRRTAVPPAVS